MIITEADLRDQVRRPTPGATVIVPRDARLSPSASDFVAQWSLVVVESDADASAPAAAVEAGATRAAWETDPHFPVVTDQPTPRCTCCGSQVTTKVDSLTQLDACHLAPKTHPRIRLRGRVDSLHALVLMAESRALGLGPDWLAVDLGTLAAYCRELTSAEYNERPVADLAVRGTDSAGIHEATHDPKARLGVPHVALTGSSREMQHWLNLCRTQAREVELVALEAFPSPHHPYGASLCHAFNRLSSAFYYLQLLLAKEES